MLILYKILMGLLKRDPRFKPLDDTSLRFYDRVLKILPSLNRKYPSKLSKLLVYRYYYQTSKSPSLLTKYKQLNWRFRLWRSSKITYALYRGISTSRRISLINIVIYSFFAASILSETDSFPGQQFWALFYLMVPKNDFMLSFILENFGHADTPEYYKKDFLTLGIDRLILKGIDDKGLDSLSWMVLGTRYTNLQQGEFSYLAYQMAHYKDHQRIGGNSAHPLEGLEAAKFFNKQE